MKNAPELYIPGQICFAVPPKFQAHPRLVQYPLLRPRKQKFYRTMRRIRQPLFRAPPCFFFKTAVIACEYWLFTSAPTMRMYMHV